jgi:quaternary ammonium compound-resistance protein SugE
MESVSASAWVYLLIAAGFEIFWTFCLKELDGFDGFSLKNGWGGLLIAVQPKVFYLIGYVLFGILNVVYLSKAMKTLDMSIALPVWMGLSLVGVTALDLFWYKVAFQPSRLFFIGLIVVGILGLRLSQRN